MITNETKILIDRELDNWGRWANSGEMGRLLEIQPHSIFKYVSRPDPALPINEASAMIADACVCKIPANRAERVALSLRYRFQRTAPVEEIARALRCRPNEFRFLLESGQQWFWSKWEDEQRKVAPRLFAKSVKCGSI